MAAARGWGRVSEEGARGALLFHGHEAAVSLDE